MSNSFLERAIPIVNQAAEQDAKGNYEEAYRLYQQSLDTFLLAIKYEKNPSVKEQIKRKVTEYLDRAEKLKQHITKKETAKSSGKSNRKANGEDGDSGDDDGKKEDEDTKKLKGALAGAILQDKPNVRWTDVAGLEAAKAALKEAVILPIKFPNLFTGKRSPWKGILLFGPPGTGKTYLAKAVATEADSTFLSVSSSDLVSKWMGESERLVKQLFSMARELRPAIIFVDEIDSLCGARGEGESEASRRIKTEFLVQMQGVGNDTRGILVLGATNTPWALDPALRRRFERRIYIPLPDKDARVQMLKIHIGDTPVDLADEDLEKLGEMTEGMSGSDITAVVRDALFEPVRKVQYATHFKHVMQASRKDPSRITQHVMPCSPADPEGFEMTWTQIPLDAELAVPKVTFRDFIWALSKTKKSVGKEDVEKQLQWMTDFGQEG